MPNCSSFTFACDPMFVSYSDFGTPKLRPWLLTCSRKRFGEGIRSWVKVGRAPYLALLGPLPLLVQVITPFEIRPFSIAWSSKFCIRFIARTKEEWKNMITVSQLRPFCMFSIGTPLRRILEEVVLSYFLTF
jgi:hypothetical protein